MVVRRRAAVSFPARFILQDRISPELFAAKNRPDVIIVAYDSDERTAAAAVNQFLQKGFENVVLLTGGAQRSSGPGATHVRAPPSPHAVPLRRAQGFRVAVWHIC